MSAYIVPQSLINRIASFLNSREDKYRHLQHCEGLPVYHLSQTDDLDRLVSDLYLMNCDAVDQRYKKGTAAQDNEGIPAIQFEFVPIGNAVQVYKSMECLKYQCHEGDIPQRPLYRWLSAVLNVTGHNIIAALPEYDAAEWAS